MGKKNKNSNIKNLIVRIILIILTATVLCIAYSIIDRVETKRNVFANVEKENAVLLSEYIVYGNHFNLKGSLNIDNSNIKNVSLYFCTVNEENDRYIDLKYQNTLNGIEFFTSELINEGIDLEQIEENEYYIFVKVEFEDNTYKYYSMENVTKYKSTEKENIEYYTITRNKTNNKIDIKFGEEKGIEYMYINVKKTNLPENVYDVVIDPGHRWKRYRGTI